MTSSPKTVVVDPLSGKGLLPLSKARPLGLCRRARKPCGFACRRAEEEFARIEQIARIKRRFDLRHQGQQNNASAHPHGGSNTGSDKGCKAKQHHECHRAALLRNHFDCPDVGASQIQFNGVCAYGIGFQADEGCFIAGQGDSGVQPLHNQ